MSVSIGAESSYIDALKNQANNNAKANNANKINANVNSLSNNSTRKELEDAVKSFETYFVEEMIKTMKDSTKAFSGDNNSDGLTDYYMDFAISEVAEQMVEQYGSRITDDFVDQMQRNYGITDEGTGV